MPLLPLPLPYSFVLSTERFRAWGRDLANLWDTGVLLRAVAGREVAIRAAAGGVAVEPLDDVVRPVVAHLLGAAFDLAAFYDFASRQPVLDRLVVELAGFRPPLAPDPFESLVTSVSAQQVSLHAAFAVRNRLIERFGEGVGRVYGFPTRERLADADPAAIVAAGFSRRKADCIVGLARSDLDFARLSALADEDVKEALRALPGIGEWTADWFLARHLGRPHAWPAGDLGLRKAVSAFYAGGRVVSVDEVRAMAPRFQPFENLSAHYLLTGLRVAGGG
jgi:DNA-3-methyladenine glycosylase II